MTAEEISDRSISWLEELRPPLGRTQARLMLTLIGEILQTKSRRVLISNQRTAALTGTSKFKAGRAIHALIKRGLIRVEQINGVDRICSVAFLDSFFDQAEPNRETVLTN